MNPTETVEENLVILNGRLTRRSLNHTRQHHDQLEREVQLGHVGLGAAKQ